MNIPSYVLNGLAFTDRFPTICSSCGIHTPWWIFTFLILRWAFRKVDFSVIISGSFAIKVVIEVMGSYSKAGSRYLRLAIVMVSKQLLSLTVSSTPQWSYSPPPTSSTTPSHFSPHSPSPYSWYSLPCTRTSMCSKSPYRYKSTLSSILLKLSCCCHPMTPGEYASALSHDKEHVTSFMRSKRWWRYPGQTGICLCFLLITVAPPLPRFLRPFTNQRDRRNIGGFAWLSPFLCAFERRV